MTAISLTRPALPINLWGKIVSFLSPEQQLIIRRVNTLWLQHSEQNIYKAALLQSISKLPIDGIKTFLKERPLLIKNLVNQQFHEITNPNSKFTRELLSKIIRCEFEKDFSSVITYLQSLTEKQQKMIETLDFSSDDFNTCTDEQVTEVIQLCPNLKSLNLLNFKITGECLTKFPKENQLEKLILGGCVDVEEVFLERLFLKAACLKEVNLSGIDITGSCLALIPQNNQLEKLVIEGCKELDEEYLIDFFLRATCLKEVDLSDTNTTGEGLAQISKQNQLKQLVLEECEELNEDFLEILFPKAIHLKFLNLSNTFITGSCLTQFSGKSQIKQLSIAGCEELDEAALAFFFSRAIHLKEADLSDTNTTGQGLSNISKENYLEKIFLDRCLYIQRAFLSAFYVKAIHLKERG
ncbi:MAG: hypothetical protein PVI40_05445 [Chlamydiota bacterium]|jgi:uncharacterized protein YjbI with pentapeptide repeats